MKIKKIPMRKCVACQEMKPKKELIRIVRTPETSVEIDLKGKKSGRGAYICYNLDCLKASQKKKTLDRVLEVKLDDEIYHQLQMEIDQYNEQRPK